MMYAEYSNGCLRVDSRIAFMFGIHDPLLHAAHVAMDYGFDINRQIEDVEYVELEPDPNDGPAPMATLVYNPKK